MTDFPVSVVICTHNPRRATLQRVIDALRAQTYPATAYELMLVDNGSEPPVSSWLDLNWHPRGRFVVEDELGISAARQHAVREACSELILYIDDDNVVAADFIERSMEIARDYPHLGAWGPARIKPEYEREPTPHVRPFTALLMHYELPHDVWSNFRHGNRSVPPTAGMTVRRPVAEQWIRNNADSALRRTLGRRGNTLFTGGDDVDLSLTACDLGMGTGIFVRLQMTHVFTAGRVDPQYLLRLWEGNMFSEWVLNYIRGIDPPTSSRQWVQDIKDTFKLALLSRTERRFHLALVRGRRKARAFLKHYEATGSTEVKF